MTKKTFSLIVGVAFAGGMAADRLVQITPAVAADADVHTFCVRSFPQYGRHDPTFDPDAGVRFVVDAYGNVAGPDGGVVDLSGVSAFSVDPALVAPLRKEIIRQWKAGKQLK